MKNIGTGSSRWFTLGLVLFQEESHDHLCRAAIQEVRKQLGKPLSGKRSEFHFTKESRGHRLAFFESVSGHPFTFHWVTIDKLKLSGKAWKDSSYMYQEAGWRLIDLARQDMLQANLYFDATSSKKSDYSFLNFLKKHANKDQTEDIAIISDVSRLDSQNDDLIQLIDMMCGAAMAEDPSFLKITKKRCGSLIRFP